MDLTFIRIPDVFLLMRWLVVILFLFLFRSSTATHIVGGEFSYEYLGNNIYRITFDLYRDCENGSIDAINQDKTSSFGVFNLDSKTWLTRFSLSSNNVATIPSGFNNACINNAPKVCLNRLRFIFDRTLPVNSSGYLIVYQRCCRNSAVNIQATSSNQVGATYFTTINPQFGPNNSGVTNFLPPQIICINNPLYYDASLTDPDGDSLSYELCTAKDYNDQTNPLPDPSQLLPPPYKDIPYATGFSGFAPISGSPSISIDPVSGVISGTPNRVGRFVITVCCTEWRNGIAINVNRKDFQFEITNCSKVVTANTPLYSTESNTYTINCNDYTVQFKNTSTGGFKYTWDFGVPGISTDTSSLFEPTYTYPDTGTYNVTLYVNKGSTCPDSIRRIVKVYPKLDAGFTYSGLLCPGSPIQFTNTTTNSLFPINTYQWNFGDGNSSTSTNPVHSFAGSNGSYIVTLTAFSERGCKDTSSKLIKVPIVNFTAGADTFVLKNTPVQLNARVANTFTWTPSTFMDNPNISNPTLIFPDTGIYRYRVEGFTKEGCFVSDSITVIVADDLLFEVPNAFSPNDDGINDVLKVIQAGYRELRYFRIFDRWGKALFYTTKFSNSWDGTFNDKKCDQGVYFWMASGIDIFGKVKTIKGDVMLFR